MHNKECVAMLLAGGEGKRLGALTARLAKPAVPYGGKYRIIDFALSNCTHSDIDTVGVLTQYEPLVLHRYIGAGSPWELDRRGGGAYVLPPYMNAEGGHWYAGTADAVYRNIGFIEQFAPSYVLVLSGDHIYKMNYGALLDHHRKAGMAVTIAAVEVPWREAGRFGIIEADRTGRIVRFVEKPANPPGNLASMGVYLFDWPVLRDCLVRDATDRSSCHDFGRDVIPRLLADGVPLGTYLHRGYWKDVGTIDSLWEAHMDLLAQPPLFQLQDEAWRIFTNHAVLPCQYIASDAWVQGSLVSEGCVVHGRVKSSVLFAGVTVAPDSVVLDSVVMPGATIGPGAVVRRAIVGEGACVGAGSVVGEETGPITLVPGGAVVERTELGEMA